MLALKLITEIRTELKVVKTIQKNTAQKLTVESLKKIKGFENITTEKGALILETLKEFVQITLRQLNRLTENKNIQNE